MREKLKFRRREQASLRSVGYGFVLGVFVWPLSAAVAGLSATILLTTLAAPIIAGIDELGMGPWILDSAQEGLVFLVAFGPPFFVVSSYLVGVVAGAEASLARAMLGPRQDELTALAGGGELVVADGNHRSLAAQTGGLPRFLAVVTTPASVAIQPYNRLVGELPVPLDELVARLAEAGARVEELPRPAAVPTTGGTVELYAAGRSLAV